jgi:hypothetical protein
MKKITSLLICSFAFFKMSNAQMVVDATDFYNNPSKYNGRTIVLKDIIVHKATAAGTTITPAGVGSPGAPVSTGVTTPSSVTGGTPTAPVAPATRCNPPRNFEVLEVVFPNGQTKGCFVILSKMANPIPSGKDVVATITFKADTRLLNKVTMIKFIP